MGKTLVIAEKPSVGRDIARVLGATARGEGTLSGGDWIVSWAVGHLVTLCDPDELNPAWKRWSMDYLPMLPEQLKTKVIPGSTHAQYDLLERLMNSAEVERIVCATDSGREGELIFRYIYHQAGCRKPVDRLWISSMTDAAIREGFAAIKPDSCYDGLYESARCRSEADWLVGMNASRAFTLRYDVLLSVGRVQTPTLCLIVQRDREIEAFTPRDYWEIEASFGDYAGTWLDPESRETKCFDEQRAQTICDRVKGQTGTVVLSRREKKRMPSPQLYDLTELQRDANRLMGLSAAQTLKLAQSLYEEHKLLTYPRTDSRYLSHDMIGKVRRVISTLPAEYAELAAPLRAQEKLSVSPRLYNDAKVTDHHAIIPTGNYQRLGNLNERERRLFDLVVRRLLSMHYPDYEYESARIETRVGEDTFLSTGTTPLSEGWKAVYKDVSTRKKSRDVLLPSIAEGETRTVRSAKCSKSATKPPERMTDATLLSAMENAGRTLSDESLRESMKDSGLGTPATRAATIERLIEVGYVVRKGKTLLSTPKGARLIDVVPEQIASAQTTGKWEKALSALARCTDEAERARLSERFMSGIRRYSEFLVESAKSATDQVKFDPEERRGKGKTRVRRSKNLKLACPLCKTGMLNMNEKAYGCSRWKEGCRFTVWKDTLVHAGGPEISPDMLLALIQTGQCETPEGVILYSPEMERPVWRKRSN